MKVRFRIKFPKQVKWAIILLALASLACNAVLGGAPTQDVAATQPVAPIEASPTLAVFPTQPVATQPGAATQPVILDPSIFVTPTQDDYVAPDQSGLDLNCDGLRTDKPCEPRKIRIRGFSNPTCDGGNPQPGVAYGWFPTSEGIPWITVIHGLPGEPGYPKGYSMDAGSLLTFVKAEGGYWYVTSPEMPNNPWTLDQSQVSCATRPSADHFMKPVPTKWCTVNPSDGSSTLITVGDTYVWFGLGYKVQFNYMERYADAETLMQSGVEPDIVANNGELVPVQDFEPAQFVTTTASRKPWVRYNGELLFAPNSYCNYWEDTAP